jgi:hypothetical protein
MSNGNYRLDSPKWGDILRTPSVQWEKYRKNYRGKCGNLPEHPPGSSALLPHPYINGESSTGIKDAIMYIGTYSY